MQENRGFFIRVNKKPVPVSEEVYRAYYKARRHERYLEEKDAAHGLVHYAAFDTQRSNGEEKLPDEDAQSVEDMAIRRVMSAKLHACVALLSHDEQSLIRALYFDGKTERQYAAETDTHFMTVHSRKVSILTKLKNHIKN